MPICCDCKEDKDCSSFYTTKYKSRKTGVISEKPFSYCKECAIERSMTWQKENADKRKKYSKEYHKKWYRVEKNRTRQKEYNKERARKIKEEKIMNGWISPGPGRKKLTPEEANLSKERSKTKRREYEINHRKENAQRQHNWYFNHPDYAAKKYFRRDGVDTKIIPEWLLDIKVKQLALMREVAKRKEEAKA